MLLQESLRGLNACTHTIVSMHHIDDHLLKMLQSSLLVVRILFHHFVAIVDGKPSSLLHLEARIDRRSHLVMGPAGSRLQAALKFTCDRLGFAPQFFTLFVH